MVRRSVVEAVMLKNPVPLDTGVGGILCTTDASDFSCFSLH